MNDSIVIYHNPKNNTQTTSPTNDYKKVVIWLHGLGANGHDFVPIVPELGIKESVKFIFPNAPKLPVTINGGYVMSAWYDILEMSDICRKVDVVQIEKSAQRILLLVEKEAAFGIQPADIVIAGFSQGGAVAYHSVLKAIEQGIYLGGLLALSTYFASEELFKNTQKTKMSPPTLICHGVYDAVVSPIFAEKAVHSLTNLGFNPVLKTYPMAHQVCQEQIQQIGEWLNKVLAD